MRSELSSAAMATRDKKRPPHTILRTFPIRVLRLDRVMVSKNDRDRDSATYP